MPHIWWLNKIRSHKVVDSTFFICYIVSMEKGYWFTTETGTHIHAEEGETPKEAMKKAFSNFKKPQEKKFSKFKKNDTDKVEVSAKNEMFDNINDKRIGKKIIPDYTYDKIVNHISNKNISNGSHFSYEDNDYSVDAYLDERGNLHINNATNYQDKITEKLNSKNVKFEKSKISNSLYFTYDGTRYRVSDHKRPRGIGYNEEEGVDKNIIVSNARERYDEISKILSKPETKTVEKKSKNMTTMPSGKMLDEDVGTFESKYGIDDIEIKVDNEYTISKFGSKVSIKKNGSPIGEELPSIYNPNRKVKKVTTFNTINEALKKIKESEK